MDFFDWQGAGGVNSGLLTTSATQAGRKRRDVMVRYGLGLVLFVICVPRSTTTFQYARFALRAKLSASIYRITKTLGKKSM
ncbi:hypothetical protein [Noviherbaspirillum sp. Root189]|uniref:hypothetical protein n=1 Tax=Noviherbaspirillum sp. Root189 TaxID=1736487 RepID=UPI0012E3DBFD|nr:hypothetical protein [Noviherbaspirillum sp. Root189]